jgi:hypothetical protein
LKGATVDCMWCCMPKTQAPPTPKPPTPAPTPAVSCPAGASPGTLGRGATRCCATRCSIPYTKERGSGCSPAYTCAPFDAAGKPLTCKLPTGLTRDGTCV